MRSASEMFIQEREMEVMRESDEVRYSSHALTEYTQGKAPKKQSPKLQLFLLLLDIEPKGEFSKIIHWGVRNGSFDEVIEMLHRQSIDAPEEIKELIGEQGIILLQQNVAA